MPPSYKHPCCHHAVWHILLMLLPSWRKIFPLPCCFPQQSISKRSFSFPLVLSASKQLAHVLFVRFHIHEQCSFHCYRFHLACFFTKITELVVNGFIHAQGKGLMFFSRSYHNIASEVLYLYNYIVTQRASKSNTKLYVNSTQVREFFVLSYSQKASVRRGPPSVSRM